MVRMMDGAEFEGRIRNCDRFSVILDCAGADHMIFRHVIAVIKTPKPISNYLPSH